MHRLPPFLPVAALIVVAAVASGCAAVPVAAEGVAAEAPVVEELPAGALTGFLVAVTTDPATITIDAADWISDDAAPNGYRIDNPDPTTVDLALADDVEIRVRTATGDPSTTATVTVEGLQAWFAGLGPVDEALFDVIQEDGEVVELRFLSRP